MDEDGCVSGIGPGRPRQTTHDEIRAVAMALFAEQGFERTSLNQIARAAGIGRTTLFAYFPAKRDLMWDEFDDRVARMRASLAASRDQHPVDRIAEALLAISQYSPAEHDALMQRWRIMADSEELRLAASRRTEEMCDEIVAAVSSGCHGLGGGPIDQIRVADLTSALRAVGERCAAEWGASPGSEMPLQEFTDRRMRPLVEALRPLLD